MNCKTLFESFITAARTGSNSGAGVDVELRCMLGVNSKSEAICRTKDARCYMNMTDFHKLSETIPAEIKTRVHSDTFYGNFGEIALPTVIVYTKI